MRKDAQVTLRSDWPNQREWFRSRLELLIRNAVFGLLLVLAALALFLDLRLAFWVSAGIFVAFVGTFAVMPLLGLSINMMSLFAFILAIGLVPSDPAFTAGDVFRVAEGVGPDAVEILEAGEKESRTVEKSRHPVELEHGDMADPDFTR